MGVGAVPAPVFPAILLLPNESVVPVMAVVLLVIVLFESRVVPPALFCTPVPLLLMMLFSAFNSDAPTGPSAKSAALVQPEITELLTTALAPLPIATPKAQLKMRTL